ncbi:SRPBCC family protein [Salisediminibacterium halotolerans]|uniref:SRPBCC family protein n=1 Tax=Salisediminibacterium halotolerans TaxID=517425 RepID=UPI00116A071A|nr:SRPBCC family protein [Salisediminibacterium halotolerans]GEL07751.1 hypothetical protein SHA02_11670 [Salisediminibacterium halotolerans]
MVKTWKQDVVIQAPIEQVSHYFEGGLAERQKIMPNVTKHEPVAVTEKTVGSVYRQAYQKGNRTEEYDVHITEYYNSCENKRLEEKYILGGIFEITTRYELEKLDESKVQMTYTMTNKPLKWYVKPFLFFASHKVVDTFVKVVKTVAEQETAAERIN